MVSSDDKQLLAAADASAAGSWRPISLDPRSTLGAAAVAASCAIAFWIVGRAAGRPSLAKWLRGILLAGGAALAGFGLVYRLWDYDQTSIYWRFPLPDVATPFGPYVNRNHFAGVMLLFIGVAAGSALAAVAAGRRLVALPALAAGAVSVLALAATGSRGAGVGLLAGAACLVWGSPRGGRIRLVGLLAGAVAAFVAVLAVLGLLGEVTGRIHLGLEGRESNRFAVQWDAVRVFAGAPVFGTGAGTFAAVYPPFQTVTDMRFFSNAHSDWAQFLMETGLVGAAFVAAALSHLVPRLRHAAREADPRRWLVIGPAAGCAAMCVHGFFETNLHLPANALLFATTLSLAYGASMRAEAPA